MNKELKEFTEELKELSIEELANIKVETEDIMMDIDSVISKCDKLLNS